MSGNPPHGAAAPARLLLRWMAFGLGYILILLLSAWSAAAIFFDGRFGRGNLVAALLLLAGVSIGLLYWKRLSRRLIASVACFAVVLLWWLSLKPSQEGPWQADVSRTAYAEVNGSQIVIHNFRNCDYRAEFDYTCAWLTRSIDLNQVTGVDLFVDHWDSPIIAHTIVSFEIGRDGDGHLMDPIAFSIEARKRTGQSYSAIRGFFRQYTLIAIASDERDVVRVRTNYRKGEDLYLYHTEATPEFARSLLLDYLAMANRLHEQPEWYNAVTRNCTTEIFTFQAMKTRPLDWRILFNGYADEMLYNQDELAANETKAGHTTKRLSFAELKREAYINPTAKAFDQSTDFSQRIRDHRPGFGETE